MSLITDLRNSEWKPFEDIESKSNTPYWFKKENGSICLATWINTGSCAGWAATHINDKGSFIASTSEFHIIKNALVQLAIKES